MKKAAVCWYPQYRILNSDVLYLWGFLDAAAVSSMVRSLILNNRTNAEIVLATPNLMEILCDNGKRSDDEAVKSENTRVLINLIRVTRSPEVCRLLGFSHKASPSAHRQT